VIFPRRKVQNPLDSPERLHIAELVHGQHGDGKGLLKPRRLAQVDRGLLARRNLAGHDSLRDSMTSITVSKRNTYSPNAVWVLFTACDCVRAGHNNLLRASVRPTNVA
jgi:hypothetical protein